MLPAEARTSTLPSAVANNKLTADQAAKVDRPAFFGMSEGGPMSILFASTYPERVKSLTLYGTYPSCRRRPGYPHGFNVTMSEWSRFVDRIVASQAGDREAAQDPDPHDNGDLAPAERLEVVVDRGHLPQPLALAELEPADLRDDRDALQHEHGTDDRARATRPLGIAAHRALPQLARGRADRDRRGRRW